MFLFFALLFALGGVALLMVGVVLAVSSLIAFGIVALVFVFVWFCTYHVGHKPTRFWPDPPFIHQREDTPEFWPAQGPNHISSAKGRSAGRSSLSGPNMDDLFD